jgi:DNA primase
MQKHTVSALFERLRAVRKSGSGWTALCPAHEDTNAGLSIKAVSGTEILDRVSMPELLNALGFSPARANRTRCILHKGDSPTTFSINPNKGTWYCFKCNEGGGKLRLVERALGLDRKAALRWLGDLAGVPVGGSWSDQERREWAKRRKMAEIEARHLVAWRNGLMEALREARNTHLRAYHRGKSYIIRHGLDGVIATFAVDLACYCEEKYQDLDKKIEAIERAPFEELLRYYRATKRAETA